MESLEVFILSGCSRLKKFPKIVGNMSHLSKLDLSETPIKHLPAFVKHLTVLTNLDLSECWNLSSLPDANCHLTNLTSLNLSYCSKLDKLPESLGNIKRMEELNVSHTAIRELPSSIGLLEKLKVLTLIGCVELSYSESLNKLLHSLSGLCSLTELDLRVCNLSAVPDVVGCLSSLKLLNLAGNDFVCLPESIIQLTNLEALMLLNCTDLQSLPWLPLNIKEVNLEGCTSLETIPIRPEFDFQPVLHLLGCFKITEYQGNYEMMSMMLRRYMIKDPRIPGRRIFTVDIPEWVIEQNKADSEYTPLHVKLGDNWNQVGSLSLTMYSDECNKIAGIFLRASFRFNQHHPPDKQWGFTFKECILGWVIKVNKEYFGSLQLHHKLAGGCCHAPPEQYHLWSEYVPCPHFNGDLKKALSKSDANGISEIEFIFITTSPGLDVRNCAAWLVYEHDIEQYKQIQAESRKLMKRYWNYDGEGAGLSGEGTSNDIDVPLAHYIQRRFDSTQLHNRIRRKSGEGTSNNIYVQRTKDAQRRFDSTQLPNLIERHKSGEGTSDGVYVQLAPYTQRRFDSTPLNLIERFRSLFPNWAWEFMNCGLGDIDFESERGY